MVCCFYTALVMWAMCYIYMYIYIYVYIYIYIYIHIHIHVYIYIIYCVKVRYVKDRSTTLNTVYER